MITSITDQCGRWVQLPSLPQKIVSLVPSQTELLYDLGLENHIVGITRFCIHPAVALENKKVVGGTKKIVEKRLIDLNPDLIICNKEENTKAIVDFCETVAPTYVSDIARLDDALQMILQIGTLTGTIKKATEISTKISVAFKKLSNSNLSSNSSSSSSSSSSSKLKALYLIWKNPYMSIGSDTFIHHMMECAGFENVLQDHTRYPQIDMQQIVDLQPEMILLSSEPYHFKEVDIVDFELAYAKANKNNSNIRPPKIMIVNGELFSWYGSRLLQSPAYFEELGLELTEIKA